jgi:hypothetical protein
VTKHNSRKRGRPISPLGALLRELDITRLQAWKWMRLAEIPEDQFEALLKDPRGIPSTDGMLRAAGKLSPDRPRPPERARAEAIQYLEIAMRHHEQLRRELLETGSESELALANVTAAAVMRAMLTLFHIS